MYFLLKSEKLNHTKDYTMKIKYLLYSVVFINSSALVPLVVTDFMLMSNFSLLIY